MKKWVSIITLGATLLGIGILAVPMLSSVEPAQALGPLRQSVMIIFVCFFFFVLDQLCFSIEKNCMFAWLLFSAGVAWFTIWKVVAFRDPDGAATHFLRNGSFIAVMLLIGGLTLRILAFTKGTSLKPEINDKQLKWFTLAAFLFVFLSFIPLLSSPFCWDDAFFSARMPAMRITGDSIWQRTLAEILHYGKMGRLNPFATFQFIMFYALPDVRVYKAVMLLLVMLDCFLFYRFLLVWQKSAKLACSALFILPLCIQLRLYHDPMTGYYGLMQMMLAELLISLIFFCQFLDTGRKKPLIISSIFFLIGLTSYEMFYPMLLLYPLIAWFRKRSLKETIRFCLPYGLLTFVLLAVSAGLRISSAQSGDSYSGTAFSLDPMKIISTWFNQSIAAFPFSYQIAGNDGVLQKELIQASRIFSHDFNAMLCHIDALDIIAAALAILVLGKLFSSTYTKKLSMELPLCGLLLVLLPGMTIALSQKYQEQILPGTAYIPVYFEYFGAVLILISVACYLNQVLQQRFGYKLVFVILFAPFCTIYLLNQQNNRQVIDLLRQSFLYPRETGEQALRTGLLDAHEENERTLLSANRFYLWEHGWMREPFQDGFYSLNSGRPLKVLDISAFAAANSDGEYIEGSVLYPQNTDVVEYYGTEKSGLAKYGQLRETSVDIENFSLIDPIVAEVYIFIKGFESEPNRLSYKTRDGIVHESLIRDNWLIKETKDGRVFKIEEAGTIYFDSIGLLGYQ